jgi:Acyl-CoA dehydrogenase, C-terminal domain
VRERDSDLEQFAAMLPKLLEEQVGHGHPIDTPETLASLRRALDESDVSNLARETVGMADSLHWLTTTVGQIAHTSPSVAFALASRYTAQRALLAADGQGTSSSEAAAGAVAPVLGTDGDAALRRGVPVPHLFDPELMVLLDVTHHRAVVVDRSGVDTEAPARTGLMEARLRQVRPTSSPQIILQPAQIAAAIHDWAILTSAVSLGLAERVRNAAQSYANDRRQFGASLLSFPALRAMLANMHVRVAAVHALLDRALDDEVGAPTAFELSATAASTAVEVALDAIQIHGGYGYIDEYPVAGLLRDAVSMRARGCPPRTALATVADMRLGPVR